MIHTSASLQIRFENISEHILTLSRDGLSTIAMIHSGASAEQMRWVKWEGVLVRLKRGYFLMEGRLSPPTSNRRTSPTPRSPGHSLDIMDQDLGYNGPERWP